MPRVVKQVSSHLMKRTLLERHILAALLVLASMCTAAVASYRVIVRQEEEISTDHRFSFRPGEYRLLVTSAGACVGTLGVRFSRDASPVLEGEIVVNTERDAKGSRATVNWRTAFDEDGRLRHGDVDVLLARSEAHLRLSGANPTRGSLWGNMKKERFQRSFELADAPILKRGSDERYALEFPFLGAENSGYLRRAILSFMSDLDLAFVPAEGKDGDDVCRDLGTGGINTRPLFLRLSALSAAMALVRIVF